LLPCAAKSVEAEGRNRIALVVDAIGEFKLAFLALFCKVAAILAAERSLGDKALLSCRGLPLLYRKCLRFYCFSLLLKWAVSLATFGQGLQPFFFFIFFLSAESIMRAFLH